MPTRPDTPVGYEKSFGFPALRKTDERKLTRGQLRKMVGFERSAWARKLKRQGFDVLGDTPRAEIMQAIHGCLKGYYEYKGTKD